MNPDWMNQLPEEWELKPETNAEVVRTNYRNQGRLMERKRIIEALEAEGEVHHIRTIKRIIEGIK